MNETHCACGHRRVPSHHYLYGFWGMWCLKRGDCTARVASPMETEIEDLKSRIFKLEQKAGALPLP